MISIYGLIYYKPQTKKPEEWISSITLATDHFSATRNAEADVSKCWNGYSVHSVSHLTNTNATSCDDRVFMVSST